MEKKRFKSLNEYLKEKYKERTLKICIDGGFTCPNRDGSISTGGCIFCSEKGSGDHLKRLSITAQIDNHLNSYRGARANKFIAYFQNYTNTYDSLENLKLKYDEAISNKKIVALVVATRPDCINENICKLIASYKDKVDVWVELGLQTANDKIGKLINRGYDSFVFTEAVSLLNKYNIDVVAHIIIGLPGETFDDIKNTVDFINKHNIQGLKIHSCYVVENTVLADMYKTGKYDPISLEYYIENACYILTHINPNIVIHKISGDAPKDLLIAPKWNLHKKWIMNGIDKYLNENNLYQGIYYKKEKMES